MTLKLGLVLKNDYCLSLKNRQVGSKIRYYDKRTQTPVLLVELPLLATGGWTDPLVGQTIGTGWLPRTAIAAGVATDFEYLDSMNNLLFTGSIGVAGSNALIIVDSPQISFGQTISLTILTFNIK